MLEGCGIEHRHFAVDPETRRLTHTVSGLGEVAARRALESAGRRPEDVELLVIACPNYDCSTPPTSTLLQERLGIERCAEMEIHSNCSGLGKAAQAAYDALRLGRYRNALIVLPQLSSVYLRAAYFNQNEANKTQAALRYILADGAGAVLFETAQRGLDGPLAREVLGTYVESVGGKLTPAMTAGGGVADLLEPAPLTTTVFDRGRHHLDQDFAAVSRHAATFLIDGTLRMLQSLQVDPRSIQHFVFSIPTMQLYEQNFPQFIERLHVTPQSMQFRATRTGYCGGASVLIHFDDMVRSGELKSGELTVLHSVESSKWMTAGFLVRA
jgi:3-oxoacyl-[acyl-carrier-protein] synthase-3